MDPKGIKEPQFHKSHVPFSTRIIIINNKYYNYLFRLPKCDH